MRNACAAGILISFFLTISPASQALGDQEKDLAEKCRRFLLDYSSHPAALVRMAAAKGLATAGDTNGVSELSELLKVRGLDIDHHALKTITDLRLRKLTPEVIALTKSDNPDMRWLAVGALGSLGGDAAKERLRELMRDDEDNLRAVRAALALAQFAPDESKDFLLGEISAGRHSYSRRHAWRRER